ncbi:MAG: hypothetical protein GY847_30120 [Proteobacteria bacterium]|nr:hypothetical protein [Pseudomonadota bacterium]
MRYCTIILILSGLAAGLAACGGVRVTAEQPSKSQAPDSKKAIGIVRASFDAMGGIERLRLIGSKASIKATVSADGKTFPVEITLGGPDRWNLDYVGDDISYTYKEGSCRKVVYKIPAHCTPNEEVWMDPTRILSGLLFPASDAANLNASFRLHGEETIDGKIYDVVEVRPRNTNLRLRVMYDRQTRLLKRSTFATGSSSKGDRINWIVDVNDWREVDKIKVPFARTVRRGDKIVWEEAADAIDFEYEEHIFGPPIPTTTDQPLAMMFPARRIVHIDVEGQSVEVPAPYTTVGGGPSIVGKSKMLPRTEVISIVLKGKIADAVSLKGSLQSAITDAGRTASGDSGIILLEKSGSSDEPMLMILYVPLVPKDN